MADKKGKNTIKGVMKTANYDFEQIMPRNNMGAGSFANMPEQPMIRPYAHSKNIVSGVVNDFSCGLEEESGIYENQAE